MSTLTEVPRPKAVLVSVQLSGVTDAEQQSSLKEVERLCETLGFEVVGEVTQKRQGVGAATLLGTGKLRELAAWTGGTGIVPKGPPGNAWAGRSRGRGHREYLLATRDPHLAVAGSDCAPGRYEQQDGGELRGATGRRGSGSLGCPRARDNVRPQRSVRRSRRRRGWGVRAPVGAGPRTTRASSPCRSVAGSRPARLRPSRPRRCSRGSRCRLDDRRPGSWCWSRGCG